MSDYEFPELPSDEELGITDADREKYGEELPDDGPELSDAEMAALLGDSPSRKGGAGRGSSGAAGAGASKAAASGTDDSKAAADEARRRKKQEKERARDEKRKAKAARKAAAKAEKQAGKERAAAAGAGAAGSGTTSGSAADAGSAGGGGSGTNGVKSGGAGSSGAPPADTAAAAATTADRSSWRGVVTLAVLLLTVAVASTRTGLPRPVPADAADTLFSSARAMSTLVEMAREPHPTGSPEHARVRTLLVDRLSSLGLAPEVRTTTTVIETDAGARAATVRNIVAVIPGTAPTGTLLITAHYDSGPGATGAGDDGAGVVAILEALRAVRAGAPLRNDVVVLLSDAEELGLLGARAFAAENPLMQEVDLVVSLEMRGAGGPSIMFETNELNGWVVEAMKSWTPAPSRSIGFLANSMSYEVYRRMPNGTDFTIYKDAGIQGLNFAGIDRADRYHQLYDTPDHVAERTIQHHGDHALGALRYFGEADLTAVNATNVVYFSVPGLGLVTYDRLWVLPLSAIAFALLVLLGFVARRAGTTLLGVLGGMVVSVVAMGLSYALGHAVLTMLPRFHEEAGSLVGSVVHGEGWYVLGLAFGSLAIVSVCTGLVRPWLKLRDVAIGAVLLPGIGAVVLGFATPLAAMNLQWPVLLAAVAALLVVLLGLRAEGPVGWFVSLLLAVPVLLVLTPVLELVWLALTFRLAGVVAALMAMSLLLCLPALAGLRHPNAWWAPLATALLAVICVGTGVLSARPSDDRPEPSTLLYAYEHGTGNAMWVTDPVDDVLTDDGRIWAVERAGATFTESRDLTAFGYGLGEVPTTPAPVTDAPPPTVLVVGDTLFGAERRVVLSVRSPLGAEVIAFQLDDQTRLTALNGVRIGDPEGLRLISHWGVPENGELLLELSMQPGAPIGMHIVEHLLRPEVLFGTSRFERPAYLVPDVTRSSDRVMLRFSVADFADPMHAIVPIPASPGAAPVGTSPAGDSVAGDSVVGDTPVGDSTVAVPDSLPLDPAPSSGQPADTVSRDAVSADTVPRDTVSADTVPGDTTPPADAAPSGDLVPPADAAPPGGGATATVVPPGMTSTGDSLSASDTVDTVPAVDTLPTSASLLTGTVPARPRLPRPNHSGAPS